MPPWPGTVRERFPSSQAWSLFWFFKTRMASARLGLDRTSTGANLIDLAQEKL